MTMITGNRRHLAIGMLAMMPLAACDKGASGVGDAGADERDGSVTDSASGGGTDSGTVAPEDSELSTDTGTETATAIYTETDTRTDTGVDSGVDSEVDSGVDSEVDSGTGEGVTISDLFIEPNPNSVLSCYVNWTTDVPAGTEVQFGEEEPTYRVRGDEGTTAHRVLVIGMRADTEYRLRAVSETLEGGASDEIAWSTGSLPDIVPVPELVTREAGAFTEGWTLTNVSADVNPAPPAVAVMFDDQGRPVWYYIDGEDPDERGDIDTRLLQNGNVLVGPTALMPPVEVDLAGNIVWIGPPQVGSDSAMNHHMDKLDNGNYLTIRDRLDEEWNVNDVIVEEFSAAFDVVWQWHLLDYVTVEDQRYPDWCHGNSVTIDGQQDALYLSCRNLQTLFKASLSGGDILWRLGQDGDFDLVPPRSSAWFGQFHDPEFQENGNVLLYDNGDIRGGSDAASLRSRVLEYALDEASMIATLVWEFPGDFPDLDPWFTDEWFTPIWGDADRLENGNTLITAGTRSPGDQSRIFEVTPDGRVVWDIRLPLEGGAGIGVYRAQRIPVPPLIEKL